MSYLQDQHYITYTKLGRGNLIKFSINGWKQHNNAFDYNYPCLKDAGFFFFPIASVHELISMGKCSEMDIVLDLWIHAIYNDEQVQGSEVGPVVYFRNCTGNPLTNYGDLSVRWGISKASVSRILNKLQTAEYLSLVSFPGRHGSVIYLCNYLSTMFNISDVMIDKEEISMAFQISIIVGDVVDESVPELIKDEQITVSDSLNSVSKHHIRKIIEKVAEILAAQGVFCCECHKTRYILYGLSDCKETKYRFSLNIDCPDGDVSYQFELILTPTISAGKNRNTLPKHFTDTNLSEREEN